MAQYIKRFVLVYILMLTVILAAFFYIYSHSTEIVEQNLVNNRLANLQQIRTSVDLNLVGALSAVENISANWQIRNFANIENPYQGPNIIRLVETISAFQEYNLHNALLTHVYIIFDTNDVVITSSAAWPFSRFASQYMIIDGLNPDSFRELLFAYNYHPRFIPANTIHVGGWGFEAIQYVTPISTHQGNTGVVVAIIDNRAMQSMFNVQNEHGETALIINSSGDIITALAASQYIPDIPLPAARGEGIIRFERDGTSYLMSYTSSNSLDWIYVSIIRSDYALAQLNMFRQSVLIVLAVMTLVILVITVVYYIIQSRPIRKLHDTISAQMPLLQHSYLRDLFDGKLEKEASADSLGFDLSGSQYTTVLIKGKETPMDLTQMVMVQMLAARHVDENVRHHVLNLGGNELAMLFIGQGINLGEHVRQFMESLSANIASGGISGVAIGIGNSYNSLSDVQKSFTEAAEAIQYFIVLGSSDIVCSFSDIPTNKEFYYYPEEDEKRLLNMVRSGDENGVRAALKAILDENFVERKLSNSMMTAFVNHLCLGMFTIGRVGLISDELASMINEFYDSFNHLSDIEKMTRCTQLYAGISKNINTKKQNKMLTIATQMKEECEANYKDPSLSLTTFADRYNHSEAYLSQQFKEQTGESFHFYLQGLRIKRAIELLTTTKKPIHEISEVVGYTSYNTFSKAFKRKTGINAGDYRKHKNSIEE